jgi:tetratricopeptide (TPR) repeat protein
MSRDSTIRRGLIAVFLAVGLPVGAFAFELRGSGVASAESRRRHGADLTQLDSYLAAGESAAAAALLLRLEPELHTDERFALDAIHCLLGRRAFAEARDLWNRLGQRIQESVRSSSGQALAPAAERDLQRRVAEAWFVQGLLTARFGEKPEALRLLRDADGLGFPPLDSPLMVLAADSLHELQEYALAAQAYREVLKRSPGNVPARLRLGDSLYATGQLAGAEKELREVLRRAPATPQVHYELGAVQFEQKRNDEAKVHLERELARDARCFRCMAKLAHLAYLAGDDLLCESWLAKAAALDPEHLETNLVSGMLENRTGRYDLAIQHLSRVVQQAPGYTRAQYQLALAYERSGNAGKAREHLEIYNRLIQEEKARTIGVRGAEE